MEQTSGTEPEGSELSLAPAETAAFVASLLPEGLRIADIGCGAMDFERFAKPREYRPIDRVARDERTRVVDPQADRLPPESLKDCDLAALLGVLEHLADPRPMLASLADAGCAVVFTYHPTDLPRLRPESPRWKSHFSTAQLEEIVTESGFTIARRFNVDASQRVYLCHPAQHAPEWIARPRPYRSLTDDGKPTLVVAGFYARGNCGDEALLQCVCEAMQSDFHVMISLDEHGAHRGYWDWYPYDRLPRTHQTNLTCLQWKESYAGLLLGGGGLPPGFAANQVLYARSCQAATALGGVDFSAASKDPRLGGPRQQEAYASAMRQYADLFDFRALRTAGSIRAAAELGLNFFHGGDWALKLPVDADPSVTTDDRRALLVLRETELKYVDFVYLQQVLRMITRLEESGYEPHFLPFCPQDEQFLARIGLDRRLPVIRTWWNPRRAKQWISSSGLTLSIGRLHPVIFAAPTGARIACVANAEGILTHSASTSIRSLTTSKLTAACDELGVRMFSTVEEAIAGLASIGPADPEKVDLSLFRLEGMTDRLRRLFRESAASRAGAA